MDVAKKPRGRAARVDQQPMECSCKGPILSRHQQESRKPNLIIGDFVDYLLQRHRKRVKLITVLPS
jgi:hypothetical protein